MTALVRLGVAAALAVWMAGCMTPAPGVPSATVTPQRTRLIPAESARNAIAVGKSSKADVLAALGDTLVISFDSGFEVWVYRLAGDTPVKAGRAQDIPRAEFVVLFAPSGLVAKTRIRPAPPKG